MSKVEQLRALREARFSHIQRQNAASASSKPQTPAPATNPFATGEAKHEGQVQASALPSPTVSRDNSLRPPVESGKAIGAYSQEDLEKLMQWIHLNNINAAEEELIALGMQELGFVRKGKVIQQRLTAALRKS